MAYAPEALKWLAREWDAAIPTAVFSGIVGDSNHTYGYHRAPNEIPRTDYSLQYVGDRPVDGIDMSMAAALDMSMGKSDMILVTTRIYNSWKDANDPRLNYWREAIGTLDGVNVIYMDCQTGQRGSADSSHLWHVHVGGLRIHMNNMEAMKAMLSVIKGETVAQWRANMIGESMFCKYGDKSGQVWVLQSDLNNAGFGPVALDWIYGDQTAAALVKAGVCGGDKAGKTYGPGEYAGIQKILRKRDAREAAEAALAKIPVGPMGPPGPQGPAGPVVGTKLVVTVQETE